MPPGGGAVWLASFPKSGNTWLRLLLANLLSNQDKPVSINSIPLKGRSLVRRTYIEDVTLIDTDLLTLDEALLLRPRMAAAIIAEASEDENLLFVKTHDAYCRLPECEPLLGRHDRGAAKALYIVRDPRDVVVSLASHMSYTVDEAVRRLCMDDHFIPDVHAVTTHLPQHLQNWSRHVNGWNDQADVPVHVIRYEDLRAEPVSIFGAAVAFLGLDVQREKVEQAVRFSDFVELQTQETRNNFRERPPGATAPFFRKGRVSGWVEVLTEEQSAQIVAAHGNAMRRFRYL
ncbi:MAG: sulfotransferase domain-containing protein [Pseudomonadota bacterium]